MIAILPFKDRLNYLRITLSSYIEAVRHEKDIHLILFSDKSLNNPEIIREIPNSEIIELSQHYGPYKVRAECINLTFSSFPDEPFILCLDSDCVVHPQAFNMVRTMVSSIRDIGLGTIFNSSKHKMVKTLTSSYGIKKDIGGLGAIIPRAPWEWYQKQTKTHGPKHKGWDWDMCLWLATNSKWKIYSTVRSYVEHIGQDGAHSGPACEIDKAIQFLE